MCFSETQHNVHKLTKSMMFIIHCIVNLHQILYYSVIQIADDPLFYLFIFYIEVVQEGDEASI